MVPYGEVIAEIVRRELKELDEGGRAAYEGDTIAESHSL